MKHGVSFLILAALVGAGAATASPILAVDLDPAAAGVQDALTVALGSSFAVDVVVVGDGTPFDNATVDTPFNDGGLVLALAGAPRAGSLAGLQTSIDAVAPIPTFVAPTGPLSTSVVPPPAGFASGTGGAGLQALGVYSPVGTFSVLSLLLDAVAVGTSTIGVTGILGADPLAFAGIPVALDRLEPAVVTVEQARPVPEPTALYLLGPVWLATIARRRRTVP